MNRDRTWPADTEENGKHGIITEPLSGVGKGKEVKALRLIVEHNYKMV